MMTIRRREKYFLTVSTHGSSIENDFTVMPADISSVDEKAKSSGQRAFDGPT